MRRYVFLFTALALLLSRSISSQPAAWPNFNARYKLAIFKVAGKEMADPFWMHLHHSEPVAMSFSVRLGASTEDLSQPVTLNIPLNTLPPGNQIQWLIRGVAVSPWLDLAASNFTVTMDNPALDAVLDGIHDLSIDVRGPNRNDFKPQPVFVHLHRGRAVEPTVPILARDSEYEDYGQWQGPVVKYVRVQDRNFVGYPMNPSAAPWHLPPFEQPDLFIEEMAPHSNLFMSHQMWWEEPPGTPSAGLKFVRGMPPKFWGEDHRVLYDNGGANIEGGGYQGHRTFPFKDGPRSVSWMSPYVTGQVDSTGGFAFVETGGPLRYLKPDGEVITIAGWRVRPDKDPIWIDKPLSAIRQNEELRGTWLSGQYSDQSGFHLPMDVAIDPSNENVWYVAGFLDHVIWKVVIADRTTWAANISVFAGDPAHAAGFVNGTGTAARFNGPFSLVFDPVCDCLYVADQDNDAIRRISRAGVVTTLLGSPGMGTRLQARGATNCAPAAFDSQLACLNFDSNRAHTQFEVTAAEAQSGLRPEPYIPMTIRVDSVGRIVLLEEGYGSIRRIDPNTGQTKLLGDTRPPNFAQGFVRTWLWLDVDRWGNSGPLDSIYWCSMVQSNVDGESNYDQHTNEVFGWLPAEGGLSRWVFGPDRQDHPDGWGPRDHVDAPHYPWLVAVDPRGGLLVTGVGEHGLSRMRRRRPSDPSLPSNLVDFYDGKEIWWKNRGAYHATTDLPGLPSMSLKFGWEGHNYLGFADAWGLAGATDQQLITAFEIPPGIVADPLKLTILLNFIRVNTGVASSGGGGLPPLPPGNVQIR